MGFIISQLYIISCFYIYKLNYRRKKERLLKRPIKQRKVNKGKNLLLFKV
jgi:hypothetical protein